MTIKEKIYITVKEEICNGTYEQGQQVHEQELAKRFDSSRSPVREALKQLVSDGLLEEYPNRGVFVKQYTAKDIDDIFDMRVMLESYAIHNSRKNITTESISNLNKCVSNIIRYYETGEFEKYVAEDARLHRMVIDLCGNSIVINMYDRIYSMSQQFRIFSLTSPRRLRESVTEHTDIVKKMLEGDAKEAERINKEHLERARRAIIRYINGEPDNGFDEL